MNVQQNRVSLWVLVLPLLVLCALSCKNDEAYVSEINDWHSARMERLKQPRGWLSLTGRTEVKSGLRTFGGSANADIRFPSGAPDTIGFLELDSNGLVMLIDDRVNVRSESGERFTSGKIDFDDPIVVHFRAFYWTFIEREGHVFLRLWDTTAVARKQLKDISRYKVDPKYHVDAGFVEAEPGMTLILDDVTGAKREVEIVGTCNFMLSGENVSLLALDGGPDDLFLIFEDLTTDVETYGGGRYLYCPRPDQTGNLMIDFNKSYNPPCAFTEFATCLLAPAENRLSIPIHAGEKKYGSH